MENGPGYRAKAVRWKTGVCGKQNKICLPPSNTDDCNTKPVSTYYLTIHCQQNHKIYHHNLN